MLRRLLKALGTVLAAVFVLVASALPAWAAQSITLTWVRHAQSQANADKIIDSNVPGPSLTALGETQAQAIGEALRYNAYDGIYASDMIRTQQTAAPLAGFLDMTPVILPGVGEIQAGIFNMKPQYSLAGIGYAVPPVAWVLGGRTIPVLGGENGNQFQARVQDSVAQIYDTGQTNPIVFSHAGTIMGWTLMNVGNPDLFVALTHPLENTGVVVVTGNPEDGWTLQSWMGIPINPNPGLLTKLFVDTRTWVVAPQTSLYEIAQAVRTGDLNAIATAFRDGVVNVVTATVDYVKAVVRDVGEAIFRPRAAATAAVPSVAAVKAQAPAVKSAAVKSPRAARTAAAPPALKAPKPAAATGKAARAHAQRVAA